MGYNDNTIQLLVESNDHTIHQKHEPEVKHNTIHLKMTMLSYKMNASEISPKLYYCYYYYFLLLLLVLLLLLLLLL